ncbi:MAG: hypothetical protein H6Q15_2187 [Bacteroidetes bacterium]|nr:hypothetical protein [Bacteroidota bacterium]
MLKINEKDMKKLINIFLKSIIIIVIITGINQNKVQAQTGVNIGFTNGNYMFWKGYQGVANGTASLVSGWTVYNDPATVYWQGSPCFVINTPTSAAFDFTVPTLRRVPTMWGYTHSSQINNNQNNKNCSKLSYDIDITPLNCLLTFNYAMVLESPGHTGYANPTFRIEVRTLSGSNEGALVNPCATFEQTGTNNPMPAGWGTFSGGIWQDWRQVAMNLSAYEGNRVRVIIIMTDCEPTGHWSYGYVTAKVGPAELTVNACGNGDTIAIIEAPSGFKKYEWISSPTAFNDAAAQYAIRQTDPFATHQYFAVKLTSPNSGSTPACEAFIKATVQSMKPIPEFDTVLDCALKVDFVDETVLGAGYNSIADTLEYTWDFGDGNTAYYNSFTAINTNRNPSHTYAAAGPYHVKLTVKDEDCVNIIEKDIVVPSTPDFTVKDSMICIGSQMTVVASNNTIPGTTYEWRESSNETDPVIFSGPAYTATFNTDKTLWVTASAPNTACKRTKPVIISVQQFPNITIHGDTMICIGQPATLTAIDSSGVTKEMQWSFNMPSNPPVITNPSPSPTTTFSPTTNTTIYLIAKTSQGCMNWKSVNIYVTDPSVFASKYKVCPKDKVTLNGVGGVTYSWSANPADPTLTTDTLADPVDVYPEETTIYAMNGYGPSGCYTQRTVRIDVVPKPEAKITYSPEYVDVDNPILSLKDDSKYSATSKWDISDGTTSTQRSFTHRFNDVSGKEISVFLTTYNEIGTHCFDTASITLPIELFSVWVPSAITPDGDGQNDKFFFFSLNKLEDLLVLTLGDFLIKDLETLEYTTKLVLLIL